MGAVVAEMGSEERYQELLAMLTPEQKKEKVSVK
jgi:hypothetical protein